MGKKVQSAAWRRVDERGHLTGKKKLRALNPEHIGKKTDHPRRAVVAGGHRLYLQEGVRSVQGEVHAIEKVP